MRKCVLTFSDAAPLRGWHSTGASGPRSCARGPPQCPVAADRRGDRLDMGARRVADTSPAHVDWFDHLCVKTALVPRAASLYEAGACKSWNSETPISCRSQVVLL